MLLNILLFILVAILLVATYKIHLIYGTLSTFNFSYEFLMEIDNKRFKTNQKKFRHLESLPQIAKQLESIDSKLERA